MEKLVNELTNYGKILFIKDGDNFTLLMRINYEMGDVELKILALITEYLSHKKVIDVMVNEDECLLIVLKPKQVVIFQLPDNGRG